MMTEPELITLGDAVCVDDASLIGHMNTKGAFSLQTTTLVFPLSSPFATTNVH